MSRFDIHMHLALEDGQLGPHKISSAASMVPHMNKQGITRGIALSMNEKSGGNRISREIAAQFPGVFYYFCNVDDDIDPSQVESFLSLQKTTHDAVGIGEFALNEWITDSPVIQAVFAAAEKLELPLLFHMSPEAGFNYGIADKPGLPMLEEALQKYPRLKLIAHSQPIWIEISGDAATDVEGRNSWGQGPVTPGGRLPYLLETYPNLYADLSANSGGQAIMRDREFGLAFLERFQDKLLFGTDMANTDQVFPLAAYLDSCLAEGSLSQAAYDKICETNALKLLSLGG